MNRLKRFTEPRAEERFEYDGELFVFSGAQATVDDRVRLAFPDMAKVVQEAAHLASVLGEGVALPESVVLDIRTIQKAYVPQEGEDGPPDSAMLARIMAAEPGLFMSMAGAAATALGFANRSGANSGRQAWGAVFQNVRELLRQLREGEDPREVAQAIGLACRNALQDFGEKPVGIADDGSLIDDTMAAIEGNSSAASTDEASSEQP